MSVRKARALLAAAFIFSSFAWLRMSSSSASIRTRETSSRTCAMRSRIHSSAETSPCSPSNDDS
jgi:hypothetical protein